MHNKASLFSEHPQNTSLSFSHFPPFNLAQAPSLTYFWETEVSQQCNTRGAELRTWTEVKKNFPCLWSLPYKIEKA